MSRETDSSSSGPQGRGGAAYPSGTPPYGSPAQGAASDGAPDGAQRQAAEERPDEPKTETTLTTRIRINIPGSRPIPPVVMRTPMAESDVNAPRPQDAGRAADRSDAGDGAGRPGSANGAGGPGSAGMSASGSAPEGPSSGGPGSPSASASAPAEEKTSDWFAPRKSGAGTGGNGTSGSGTSASGGSGPGAPGAGGPGAGGSGTGSFDVSGAVAAGPLGTGAPQGGDPQRGDLPYFSGGAAGDGGRGPSGPTGGPVTGDGPMAPNPARPADPANQANPAGRANPMAPPNPGGPGNQGGPGNPANPGHRPNPANPAARSGAGAPAMGDDTAILTPQKAGPLQGPPGGPVHGGPGSIPGGPSAPSPGTNVSGDTLTSGIPVVPPAQNSPFATGPQHTDGPVPHTPPKLPEPVQPNVPVAAAPSKKKGRNKLVLVGVAVVVVACGAYGAGLLMNHADVPKGTTVLGVDIGGGTRDEAVKKLDAAIGKDVIKPLKLSVDGETVTLKPDQAGLTLDSQATVREAAGSDYNPVSVIGSLFGGERVAEPVMPVDEEKLAAALERAAGGSGSAKEGGVKFVPGKAVPVYGKAGNGIDVAASTKAVSEGYKKQVETGSAGTVDVPVTTRKPTVANAEVDKFMTRFAKPAMSANVTIKAGTASIPFGPAKSLPKILETKVAENGSLQPHYNLAELKKLYGNVFDGILIQRGNGDKTPVQPTDVAAAMNKALIGKTPTERVGVIETNAN
ncbi:hypothetical protein GCM10009837_63490 [Streptomyces durmitorensis]|uniref:Peptidoglycan binding domain-containing protein n=1 Tax=Streptomyces durmitorensis TaxID=319947 RepID=A0ABY4PSD4_9ACTN|nr:hypothetical protein [Streptomyces durmitorensis]UQT56486.1 hypothetical protein M4V62_16040 [Streptomyces durmitorensis]